MEKSVAVTGLGVLSCIGNDVKTFWDNLVNGVCGIDHITEFPTDNLAVKIGGMVRNFNPEEYGMDKPFIRKQDPFTIYAMASAWQAMKDSGLVSGENIDPSRLGTYVPNFVPTMISDMAGGQIAIKFGAQGSCIDIVTACATSTHSIGEAFRAIKHGYADAIIAGGTDRCTIPIGIAGFANAKALTRATDPQYASLPFNANRSGFVMADGSAVVILEEMEHAKARGAHIYAEVTGYGSTCDAHHATAPRPDGTTQAECIRIALAESGFDPAKDNVYINAHGTGTLLNDVAETKAYKIALGDFAYKAHISSTKSMHGHMFGATGAVEAIATVLALQEGIVPPTVHLDAPDPECDLDYTPNKAVKTDVNLGLSDSFGFGGHNACLAFRKV